MEHSMEPHERGFLDEVEGRRASGRGINSLFYLPPLDVMTSVPMEDHPEGYTALYFAAQEGLSAAITPLLENGADVHTGLPSNPETPLHAAARSNRDNIAAVLLDAGARVDDRDRHGRTALHVVARNECFREPRSNFCQLLLSRGASLDLRDCDGHDPEASARFCFKKKRPPSSPRSAPPAAGRSMSLRRAPSYSRSATNSPRSASAAARPRRPCARTSASS